MHIELYYPNNFESSCDNMFRHMKDIIEIKFKNFQDVQVHIDVLGVFFIKKFRILHFKLVK